MRRNALWVAAFFLLPAVIEVIVRIATLGWDIGGREVLNDPGKELFHIMILPAAALFALRFLPDAHLRFLRKYRGVSRGALAIFLLIAAMYSVNQSTYSYYERNTTPEDTAIESVRTAHVIRRQEIWQEVLAMPDIASRNKLAEERSRTFRQSLGTSIQAYEKEHGLSYWNSASVRRHLATYLSFIANAFVAVMLLCVFANPFLRSRIRDRDNTLILLLMGLLALWIPLKLYSEWYHNFSYYPSDDPALEMGASVALVCCFLMAVFRTKSLAQNIFSGATAMVASLSFIVFSWKPEWFSTLTRSFSTAPPFQMLTLYALLFFGFVSYLAHVNHVLSQASADDREGPAAAGARGNRAISGGVEPKDADNGATGE